MKFGLNVKKVNPVQEKMKKTVVVGDMFVTTHKTLVIVAGADGNMYIFDIKSMVVLGIVSKKATRADVGRTLLLNIGSGDYIAAENIKTSQVNLDIVLK